MRRVPSKGPRLAAGLVLLLALPQLVLPVYAGTSAWPGGSGNWTGGAWNPSEPAITDDATFPATGGTITLGAGETALSLTFSDSYTLVAGDLTLGGTGGISISAGRTVSVASAIGGAGGLTKAGDGALVLGNTATYSGTTTISVGTLKLPGRATLPSVSSALLRLRLESDSGVVTSGSNVTGWNDQSGNGFNCTQGTGNRQPTLVANASPNGFLPAVRFDGLRDGTGDYLSSASQLQAGANGTTFFVVYTAQNPPAGGTNEDIPFYFGAAGSGQMRCMYITDGRSNPLSVGFAGYAGGDLPNKYTVPTNTGHLATFSLNDARSSMAMYDRTVGDGSSSLKWSGAESGLANTGAGYALSGAGISANYVYKGDIAAVLVYTGQLSDSDRQKVDDYLYNKYLNPSLYYGGLALPSGTTLAVAGTGTFDMNGNQQTVAALTDSGGNGGTVRNSSTASASTLTLGGTGVGAVSFSGTIQSGGANGVLDLAFTGSSSISQTLSGNVTLNSLTVSNPNATVTIGNSAASISTLSVSAGTVNIDNSAVAISSLAVSAGTVNFRSTAFGTSQTVTNTLTTPGLQTFIPTSSGNAEFHIWGGGGGGYISGSNYGGGSGCVTGTLTMVAGRTYPVMVGGGGTGIGAATAPPAAPVGGGGQSGFNGGAGQGGGLSGIFDTTYSYTNALAIAGGGGGAGFSSAGGAGGGASGVNGSGSNPGTAGTQTAPGANGYSGSFPPGYLQGGGSWNAGDSGGGGGGGGGYWGGGAGFNGDSPAGNSGGGGGSGYIGGAGVSGAVNIAGSGATPANTSSPYYTAGTGVGYFLTGGNGQVTLVAPGITGAAVTLTGGTIHFGDTGTGAAVAGADLSNPGAGVARADYAQSLTIGSYIKLPGGITATLSGAASFKASGSNLADNSVARTLNLSGGTLTLYGSPVSAVFPTVTSATLKLRLESDLGVSTSGSNVTGWNDQSGNGFNASQGAAANQPTYVAGASPNGLLGAIRFDGLRTANGDYLTGTGQLPTGSNSAFLLYKPDVNPGGAGNEEIAFNWGGSVGGSGKLRIFYLTGPAGGTVNVGHAIYGGTEIGTKYSVSANTPHIGSWTDTTTGTSPNLTGSVTLYDRVIGGTIVNKGTYAYSGSTTPPAGYLLGGTPIPTTYNYPYKGDIFAVLVYSGVLNDSDRQTVDDYLRKKYFDAPTTTSLNLPNTHIATTASSILDMGGVTTGNLGNLTVGADLTIRNVASGGSVQFGGDVVAGAASTVSLAAGAGSTPSLTLAGSNIKAANGVTLVLPAASLAGSVAVGNATGYNGTVTLGGATTLASGATVNVNAGTLSVTGSLAGSGGANVQVNSGGILGGTGTINMPVTVQAGGALAPGVGGIGTLTINSTLTLAGAGVFEVAKVGGVTSNDKVAGLTAAPDITGCTLTVSVSGDGFVDGDKWKLFEWAGGGNITGTLNTEPVRPPRFRWHNFGTGGAPNYVNPATGEIQLEAMPAGTVITFR